MKEPSLSWKPSFKPCDWKKHVKPNPGTYLTPTLLDSPVAPGKRRIVALGLLAGLTVGSGTALVVDRRTGLVFSLDELQAQLPCPLLKHLPALSTASWGMPPACWLLACFRIRQRSRRPGARG